MEYIFKSFVGNQWLYRSLNSDWFADPKLTIPKRKFYKKDFELPTYIYIGIKDRKERMLFLGDICYYKAKDDSKLTKHKVQIIFDNGRFILKVLESQIFSKNAKIYLLLSSKLLTFSENPKIEI